MAVRFAQQSFDSVTVYRFFKVSLGYGNPYFLIRNRKTLLRFLLKVNGNDAQITAGTPLPFREKQFDFAFMFKFFRSRKAEISHLFFGAGG